MTRGGFRSGAGRKSSWNNSDTQLIRVPRIFAAQLLDFARRLDAGEVAELPAKSLSGSESFSRAAVAESIEPEALIQMVQEVLSDRAVIRNSVEQEAARRALFVFIDRLVQ